jgi:hypothetical protein
MDRQRQGQTNGWMDRWTDEQTGLINSTEYIFSARLEKKHCIFDTKSVFQVLDFSKVLIMFL